jgi:hypothetical protein
LRTIAEIAASAIAARQAAKNTFTATLPPDGAASPRWPQSFARGRLVGDVHFHLAKSKSVRNGWTRALFAFQNHVDVGAIDAMVPRKSKLAALALN